MKTRTALLIAAVVVVAGCASRTETPVPAPAPAIPPPPPPPQAAKPVVIVPALNLNEYKVALAHHISRLSAARVYDGRPQGLLRSVVVVRYEIDANGNLLRSEIMRSNRDRRTEATALDSVKAAAPFPPPSPHLIPRGRLELIETWLFNNDGRFQLRTIAQPQMDR